MVKMLASVNEQVKEIKPEAFDRVIVTCNTCHRGLPRPRSLAEELTIVYDKSGADSTIARYRALRAVHYGAGSYDFRPPMVSQVGHHALEKKDTPGAIALFQLNAELYPDAANVHDNLAEAYLAAGDTAKAIAEYERSKQLDPRNEAATKALERLRRP
jgi:tetratricopeptide (TPR) repeat protein